LSTKAECKSKDTETPPATATAAEGVSLWVENKKEVKRRAVFTVPFNLKSATTFPSGEISFCKVATILHLIFVDTAEHGGGHITF
jgi:hypothetical protein